ncbi:MAG: hypothetical protein VW644_13830, partial [Alphaproteobacteria bacterium]
MPEGVSEPVNTKADTETFRLRTFVAGLDKEELDTVDDPVDLADLTAHMDGNAKAVLFRQAGPEQAEIVGNLAASRSR